MKMKKALIYHIILLVSFSLNGQDISIDANYPEVVTVGEQFRISWTVNADGGEFLAPPFDGFYKLMGPQTSYSSNTQIINGRISHQTSNSYLFYLQALKEGKYVIAPATFTLKNKTYRSDSIHIEVVSNKSGQNAVPSGGNVTGKPVQSQASNDEIFLRLLLNRNDVYIGEHIVFTVKIYTRIDLSGINEIKFPTFNGFLREDLETPQLSSLQRENVDGTVYGSGVIQQFLLYPQITGEIQIEPVQATVLVQQKTGQADPFFGDFFSSYQNVPRAIISQPVKINVKPLPGTKPDDFAGVVGKLEIAASLNKDSVNVNDAVNFKITISGSGNLKLAGAPVLKLSPDIEIYDPKITDNIKSSTSGTSGQKSFEYLLIPRHYGDYTVPPVSYTYFNTARGQYEKLSTKEFRFHARKGADQGTGITVYGGVTKEDVKYLGKDIRFIKSEPERFIKSGNIILAKCSFYSIYAFALLIFLITLFIRREHIRRNSDLSIVRNRKAAKVAGKRLQEASKCLKTGMIDKFHEEILKALWGYLSDKLNIPVSDLTRNNAFIALKEKGIDDERINNLAGILDSCEFARFSPSSSGTEASTIYDGASQFIRSVENSIR
jgi:hypothetical protein